MMIPIPRAGVLESTQRARRGARGAVGRGGHDQRASRARRWCRCPRAPSYLGFIFARAADPAAAEAALRAAHARLRFVIR